MGTTHVHICYEIERTLAGGGTTMTFGENPFNPGVKKVNEYAVEESRLLGHNHIGGEHLLLGLLREEEGIGGETHPRARGHPPPAPPVLLSVLRGSAPSGRRPWKKKPAVRGVRSGHPPLADEDVPRSGTP